MTYTEELVSIVMPSFNSENIIEDSINTVLNQTYSNWELLIVDDCSSDNTVEIVRKIAKKDKRIKIIELDKNSGAGIARNQSIKQAKGKFLAFLDSDDLWMSNKLERQINFMNENNYYFTSTDFNEIEDGKIGEQVTLSHPKLDYAGVLKYCPGNSTVIYNAEKLGKFYAPDIKKRNDFVVWLQVIKKAEYLYGLNETLTTYRVRKGSLSKNKVNLIKYQWRVYREIEDLSLIMSTYLLVHKTLVILRRKLKEKIE